MPGGIAIGLLLALGTWAALRRLVGAAPFGRSGRGRLLLLALDLTAPLLGFALFVLGTARPIVAGLAIAALGFGLGLTDRLKRAILDEPVVFADRAELIEVVRHPRFYIAFVGTVPMILGATACFGLVGLMLWAEPPLWQVGAPAQIGFALVAIALGRAAFVLPALPAPRAWLATRYRRFGPSGDPAADPRGLGLLATCMIHATIAGAEREDRRERVRARGLAAWPAGAGPVILVQGESFVDVRRLHPGLAAALPHFARLAEEAALAGRLAVPCWGANTIRTELAAVAGIGPDDLGLDRFNPYERFAQAPLPSLARVARAAGARTICVHPYARSFYARDMVMPNLGFDRFIGEEAFADAPRDAGYVTDAALARFVADLVAREGPDLFVFVITVENHGPWDGAHDPAPPAPLPPDWPAASAAQFGRWLRHAKATDAMIPVLRAALEARGQGWLGFYGDHQPSIAGPFRGPGAQDRRTDYALWPVGGATAPCRADIAAEDLPGRLLALMAGAAPVGQSIAIDSSVTRKSP